MAGDRVSAAVLVAVVLAALVMCVAGLVVPTLPFTRRWPRARQAWWNRLGLVVAGVALAVALAVPVLHQAVTR